MKLKKAGCLIGMTAFCALCSYADKPNIVYLMADDLGWVDIAASAANRGQGSHYHETPNIDQLARDGMCFTYAYVQQNCQPTRTALLTGQYAVRPLNNTYNVTSLKRYDKKYPGWPKILIQPYDQQTGGIDPASISVFEMLQAAGYHTAWFGKNHGCGADEDLPKNHGVDTNFGTNKKVKGTVKGKPTASNYLALKDDSNGWIFDGPMAKYAEPYTKEYVKKNLLPFASGNDPMSLVGKTKHYSDALGDAVTDYLSVRATIGTPFVAYVPFHAIHSGIVARPDLLAKYKAKSSADKRHDNEKYAAFVEQLDQTVGRILQALEKNGLAKNTVVVFTSDNGGVKGSNNAPLRSAKGSYYEGGLRVPFIVRWPGMVKSGAVSEQPTHCIDVYPTLAELACGSLPDPKFQPLDGVSIAPILLGEQDALKRDALFWHFPGYMDVRNHPRSLIQKRVGNEVYKLFFNYTDGSYELYNISKDISEANNLLAGTGERAMSIAKRMNRDLRSWLMENQAPNGSWRVDGTAVSYPPADMLSFEIPNQTGLKALKSKQKTMH